MNKRNKNNKISPNLLAIAGSIIILIGGFFISYNYIESKKLVAYDYMSNVFYDGEKIVEKTAKPTEPEKNEEDKDLPDVVTNDYIGYLTIPRINLNKGFLDYRATDNTVEKNIMVLEGSDYPDIEKGNFIIAGHSGTGWKAFFNDLYKLTNNDVIHVSYKGKKYTYKIVNIYKQPKVGSLSIYRNYDKTTLTLITCTNWDGTSQTVYVAELQSIIKE